MKGVLTGIAIWAVLAAVALFLWVALTGRNRRSDGRR